MSRQNRDKDFCLISAIGEVCSVPEENKAGTVGFKMKLVTKDAGLLMLNITVAKAAQSEVPSLGDTIQIMNGSLFSKKNEVGGDELYCGITEVRNLSVISKKEKEDYCFMSAIGKVVSDPEEIDDDYLKFHLEIIRTDEKPFSIGVILRGEAKKEVPIKGDHIQISNGVLYISKNNMFYCGIEKAMELSVIAYDEGIVSIDEFFGV